MEWLRHHPRATVAAAATAGIVVLALVWLLVRPASTAGDPAGPGLAVPTATGRLLTGMPTPSTSPTAGGAATAGAAEKAFQTALSKAGNGAHGKQFSLPGLQGGTLYSNMPRHHLVMSARSEAPIGTVGYIAPTSLRENYGIDKHVGTSWQVTTTVYGDPDYAQIFVQAGARGYPITCTITVDGRVTEKRSTDGPYGQLVCQG